MSENTNHLAAENLHLLSIKVMSGSISRGNDDADNKIIQFSVNFETETGTWLDEEQIKIVFTVRIVGMDEQGNNLDVEAVYTIEFVFKIDGLKQLTVQSESSSDIKLDTRLGAMMMGVVYSTTRGIVWSRTQGTIMDGVILPVVDPNTLIKVHSEDTKIDIKEA